MTKILFIHNTAMWYKRPFFKRLSEIYDVKFVFTHIQVCKDIYGVEISEEIEGLEGVNYKVLKNYFNFIKPHGVAFGVIKEAIGDYDVLVDGNWDSLSEIIEMMLYFTIAKIRKKPVVIYKENWYCKEISLKRRIREMIILPFVKFIVRNSNAILVPGTKSKEYFVSLGSSPDQIFIMPNASNISVKEEDYVTKEKLKEKLNIGTKKVVLYVGRLVKQKGVDYLIKAFAKLRKERDDIVLVIVGGGECRDELKLLAKNLNIKDRIFFVGYIENELLPPYYLLCDIFVMPSIPMDTWGFIVNEAMYFGKPVIATDAVGAAFDMIKDGENGFMVPEKYSDALYGAMKKILSDPELEERMGKESKRIIEEGFRYEHMVDWFREAIEYVQRDYRKKR